MSESDAALLGEQAAYYRARADEYDEWWQRAGRYDHGPAATSRWWQEVAEVQQALDDLKLSGDLLELACGTGWWTERLAGLTCRLKCIDASAETIAINRARLEKAGLSLPAYEVADLFTWQPSETFDAAFFSFWLSHVPPARFDDFWSVVAKALKPNGRVFFVDSAREKTVTLTGTSTPLAIQERQLNDGRTYRVVKMFYDPFDLGNRLRSLGWRCEIRRTNSYFIYGLAEPD